MPVKGCRGTRRTSEETSPSAQRVTHLQSSPCARNGSVKVKSSRKTISDLEFLHFPGP
jgi:hypothetical protein